LHCIITAALLGCQALPPSTAPGAPAATVPAATGAQAPTGSQGASASGAPPGTADQTAANPIVPPTESVPPPGPAAPPPRPLRIGLALGGGAARGFAHVGVIKALEARGIHPDIVVGTSVGAFVGALYAAGLDGAELQRVALKFEESTVTDWSLPTRGLFKGQALQDFVNREVGQRPIERLPRKLAIVATDLGNGQMVIFERGNVGMAVRASSSVPGVFQPVTIGGREYVDGGLVSPVPVQTARRLGADVVIAVDVSKQPANQSTTGAFDILLQTFTIMGQVIARTELGGADVVLRPSLSKVGNTDFAAREFSITEGEQAVAAQADRIAAVLEHARQSLAGGGSNRSNP
jgi:NTE family protein